jgi:quinol monooxygenase YgiN
VFLPLQWKGELKWQKSATVGNHCSRTRVKGSAVTFARREDEPGTLQFEILLPYDDNTKVLLYEVDRDAVAFEVHRTGSSYALSREQTAGMVVKI